MKKNEIQTTGLDSTIQPVQLFNQLLSIFSEEITELHIKKNNSTNELSAYAHDTRGNTVQFRRSPKGIQELTITQVPPNLSVLDRNEAIREEPLLRRTQLEKGRIVGLHQSTISRIQNS